MQRLLNQTGCLQFAILIGHKFSIHFPAIQTSQTWTKRINFPQIFMAYTLCSINWYLLSYYLLFYQENWISNHCLILRHSAASGILRQLLSTVKRVHCSLLIYIRYWWRAFHWWIMCSFNKVVFCFHLLNSTINSRVFIGSCNKKKIY